MSKTPTSQRRTMEENALLEEVSNIRKIRGSGATYSLDIISSGPISDAVDLELRKMAEKQEDYNTSGNMQV
jgi:hypothetical protein